MRRDDDALRQILLDTERGEDWRVLVYKTSDMSNEENKFSYNVQLLCDAGFMTQSSQHVFRMTNQGHDYLDAIRDEGIWNNTKQLVTDTGGNATLEIMKSLAIGFLKKKIEKHTDIQL